MEPISVFDIFKIGVGPSSSHTMGPWRAAQRFLNHLGGMGVLNQTVRVRTDLYGSLAKTGKGHGTDFAVILGLSGEDPVTAKVEGLHERVEAIRAEGKIHLRGEHEGEFDEDVDLVFHADTFLPFHANGIRFTALLSDGKKISETYYSVGGGFVVQENETPSGARAVALPYPTSKGEDIDVIVRKTGKSIPQYVIENERVWRKDEETRAGLMKIWRTMQECVSRGCHTEGVLPGGLNVTRRAKHLHDKLMGGRQYESIEQWMNALRNTRCEFSQILKWVSTFALAVNEENAAFGRVVTAPTNGSAGVIPAVMMYAACFCDLSAYKGVLAGPGITAVDAALLDFMLVAGELGSLFKKGATISAAMGGCQAEIGVSSAMAAGGLTQVLGGTPGQVMMAAEIAMEHHLGMTCDPIGGLVQIPCIERNTMGAIKAITAASIAIEGDPGAAIVSLDSVIKTMWDTAKDMGSKYKETAEGGLALHVPVNIPEC